MRPVLFACLAVLILAGCDRNPVEEYGERVQGAYTGARETADEASLRAIQAYIRSYRAMNGTYPESREALQAALGAQYDLEPYDYDPESGTLRLR